MRIFAVSDIHGYLPEVPDCDLLLIGGDICPWEDERPLVQREWLQNVFRLWLDKVPARQVVGVAGNHDNVFEQKAHPRDLPWVYLQDEAFDFEGVKIWGSPWQPWFYDFAFNAPRKDPNEAFLRDKWAAIPEGSDILLLHGPPYGYGDRTQRLMYAGEDPHVGAKSINAAIRRVKPKAVICGHIHEGYGAYRHQDVVDCMIYNVSHMDSDFAPNNPVVEITA